MSNPKFSEKYCDELVDHMEEGRSVEQFAAHLRISKRTLYKWFDQYPEFQEAKDVGTMLSQAWWEELGRKYVIERGDGKINTGVYFINMRNRFNWKSANTPHEPDEKESDIKEVDEVYDMIKKIKMVGK